MLSAAHPGGADPRIGSWTLVTAQSNLTPPDRLTVTALPDDAVHIVMSGETKLDFTAKSNGHGTPVSGNPGFNQVAMHRIDKKQVEVKEMKDGAVVATVREKLSKDANELTLTTARTGEPDQTTLWIRRGDAKVARDPLAGEWTLDPSKTRLLQGLALKIEPSGNGGVRFSGEFSYTARFDGRQYDVENSRNDNVTLALVDPHTVEAVYRRDAQVTQNDRWVVSSDGQHMTLTSTATLETGQLLTEKLEFKKQ